MTHNRLTAFDPLFARTRLGIKPGLELMRELLAALDNPEGRFLSIHVAGTNGKGSTCALLEEGVRAMGMRTGLFTSPHLVRVNERIRIQGGTVDEAVMLKALARVQEVEQNLSRLPTFFETLTAVAFLVFAEQKVQVAVLETGMGGRLDSTNVVTPLVSVITRVDMDHQEFLGDTLEDIAGEKAGIIKSGRPVVLGAQPLEAETVLRSRAEELGCLVRQASLTVSLSGRKQSLEGQQFELSTSEQEIGRVKTPLLGTYQLENIATAVAGLETVADVLNLHADPKVIRHMLQRVRWPARGEVVSKDPAVLVDVAHNPGGAAALSDLLSALFGKNGKGTVIFASMKDKDTRSVLRILSAHVAEVWAVSVGADRSRSPEEVATLAEKEGLKAHPMTVAEARRRVAAGDIAGTFACVTGSVYLAGAWTAEADMDPGEGGDSHHASGVV